MSVMCHSGMTFIPVEWSENRSWIMHKFDKIHTCRDYDAMKRWTGTETPRAKPR